jgi:hypothetical protein
MIAGTENFKDCKGSIKLVDNGGRTSIAIAHIFHEPLVSRQVPVEYRKIIESLSKEGHKPSRISTKIAQHQETNTLQYFAISEDQARYHY